jgi:eukaryotic-like serine/threonine-protein kinase
VLPRLAAHVQWVYVEAAPENTEQRLQGALARALPDLTAGLSVAETLIEVREGQRLPHNQKLLIVLDQFEQWLTGRETEEDEPLVRALRHCDGGRIQCLVMVRDDFSMAATRFMNALEVPMLEGHNCGAIDMFRHEHARRVLRHFGEAFGRLSPEGDEKGDQFVNQAVELLSDGNVVAPVRLAAFAELTRHSDWNSATLRRLGGSGGLGVALLDAFLGEDIVNLTHRQHRKAARCVLEALLPEDRTSLKGRMRSQSELMAASGYSNRPRDFATLLNMLDKELRLISSADPQQGVWEDTSPDVEGSSRHDRYFQLAHDYLVPSLNDWLTAKQRESRAGRAALLLETISSDWNARPDIRRLPSILEWLSIRFLTRRIRWTTPQRRMMAAATRRHLARVGMLIVCLALGVATFTYVQRRQKSLFRAEQDRAAAEQLLVADAFRVPEMLRELDARASTTVRQLLEPAASSEEPDGDKRLRAQLFMAPHSQAARVALLESLLTVGPAEHRIITERLASDTTVLAPKFWSAIEHTDSDDRILRAAAALATWDPDSPTWVRQGSRVAQALSRYDNPYQLPAWVESLVPIRRSLTPALIARFRDDTSSDAERSAAAIALVRFLRGDIPKLVPLVVDARPDLFPVFFVELQRHSSLAVEKLGNHWSTDELPTQLEERARLVRQRAVAAIAMARLGSDQALWSAFRGDASPDVRTDVIDRCASYGIGPQILLDRVEQETNPLGRQAALITLAEYGGRLTSKAQTQLMELCLRLFQHDVDAGVHGGAEYALRLLGENSKLAELRTKLATQHDAAANWTINGQGITMMIVHGPREFDQGAPATETERDLSEELRHVRLPHSFAISSHEITAEQFQRYQPGFPLAFVVSSTPDCPASNVTWLDAVKYCRWLSEAEGIPNEEMCYPPIDQIKIDFQPPEDWQRRIGYRLPTESEWECACRAETKTARFFGESGTGLDHYAIYNANSQDKLWPVGSLRPNPWGLFDVYGNVLEWCQDATSGRTFDRPAGDGVDRVTRSGSYRWVEREIRSARRSSYHADSRYAFLGLRVVRTLPD